MQRVPPTERKGRVHTSTITVCVLDVPQSHEIVLDERDLEVYTCRGSGAGGQHRNTTDSAVQIKHKPTGIMVRVESERSQHQNKATAMELMRARLQEAETEGRNSQRDEKRARQAGSGMRGDKRRTIRYQADEVVDHKTGKKMKAKQYLRGYEDDLH